jgi:hypothetical protein
MASRSLPIRPDLDQLRHQAKDLRRDLRRGDPRATAELREHHPEPVDPAAATLTDAQLALARSYGLPSWPRLVAACRLVDSIWRDDLDGVRRMIKRDPRLLRESARGTPDNWGPPMSYAANLGRDRIIAMLRQLGADDVQHAFERACLQGGIGTARMLHAMGARPDAVSVEGPCETRNGDGLALLLDHGAAPGVRASLRKRLRFVNDETEHEYRDVTPLGWGERFHDQAWVSRAAMRLIAERGGTA